MRPHRNFPFLWRFCKVLFHRIPSLVSRAAAELSQAEELGGSCSVGKMFFNILATFAEPEEIVSKLRQVEVPQGQGAAIAEAVRQISVTQQTFCRWRKLYGGMQRSQLTRLKELEKENQRLRRAVSDLALDKLILDLSRYCGAPIARLGHFPFESERAFPVQC